MGEKKSPARGNVPADWLTHLTVSQSPKDHTRNFCTERFLMSPLDKTVLVVEDNDLNMRLFHDVLEM